MKAVIMLDVPVYQENKPVNVYFRDSMSKEGVCVKNPIIYCKDCKYYRAGENEKEKWQLCLKHADNTDPDNFCSWAVDRKVLL